MLELLKTTAKIPTKYWLGAGYAFGVLYGVP